MTDILNKKINNILTRKIPHINSKKLIFYEGFDFVTVLADGHAFRFPKNTESKKKMALEKKLLEYLKNKVDLIIPSYEENVANDDYVYYKSITGEGLTSHFYKNLRKTEKTKICKDLAKFMNQIHSLPIPKNASNKMLTDDWPKIYKKIEKDITNNFKSDQYFKNFLDSFKNFTVKKRKKSFVHGDLSGDNIIIDRGTKKITGIIDFGDARFSDPIIDFAHFWDFGQKMVSTVINFYTNNEKERQRILEESNLYYCYIMIIMMIINKK